MGVSNSVPARAGALFCGVLDALAPPRLTANVRPRAMTADDPFRMTKLVISFNRHFFYIALAACAVGIALIFLIHQVLIQWVLGLGMAAGIYFIIASVIASYFNYDYSDLYKLRDWPTKSFPADPSSAVIIHAGFDPASGAFRARYPRTSVRVLFHAERTCPALPDRCR